jgi:ABC-type multidrug transport system fused ATPase/permease subunit
MSYAVRLFSLLRPYSWKLAAASVASCTATAGWLLLPLVAKNLLAGAFSGAVVELSVSTGLAVAAGLLLLTLTSYAAMFLIYDLAHKVAADLRLRFVDHLLKLPLAVHRERKSGELIDRLVSSVIDIERFVREMLIGILAGTFLFWGCIFMIFRINWQLALAVVITLPVFAFGLRRLMDESRRAFQESKAAGGDLTALVQNILFGIDVAKAFNAREYELKRFHEHQEQMLRTQRKWAVRGALMEPMMMAIATITAVVVLLYGNWLVSAGALDIASYIAFFFYAVLLIPQARGISMLYLGWQRFCTAIRRLDEILSLSIEADPPGAIALPAPVTGRIEFDRVTHHYPDRPRALDDVSFTIEPLEHVGIVGTSGAGKSTVFSLLLRFYRPAFGSIEIDGANLESLVARSLREAIALVPQDIVLFDDSVLNNVRYGRWKATDEEVRSACRAAQAEEFINELPQGYHTQIGERGTRLSGGQRQRLAIARALLKDAPILLLDEATSSLDTQTEQHLQAAMKTAMEGRTTLIIAHRLATVVHLNRLIVLHQGKLVDEGPHEELLLRCEQYRNLVSRQLIDSPKPRPRRHEQLAQ